MRKECTAKGATIEEAIAHGVAELGVGRDDCEFEVVEQPRKSLFGKMKEAAVRVWTEIREEEPAPVNAAQEPANEVKVTVEGSTSENGSHKLDAARAYLAGILSAMGLTTVEMKVQENEEGAVITFDGEGMAVLIGHHGETLDALQYLVALTCNRIDGEYYRITLDCGNYREKREATLQALAARIGEKVKRTGRSQLLEPMNPYERRIIHSVVSNIDGVYSKSKGEEPNRRVVILSENPVKVTFNKNTNRKDDYRRRGNGNNGGGRPSYPPRKRERTMEEILKADFKEREESAELYSKIEL